MKTFSINYKDPDTGESKTVIRDCEGLRDAEDQAYTLADKGWYRVTEVVPRDWVHKEKRHEC